MDSPPPRPLEMFFLPFPTPGHMIPLFEMGRLFAASGQHVTVITTPSNASALQPTVDVDTASGNRISLHVVPFPAKEVGLPDGIENFNAVTDVGSTEKLFLGFTLLRPRIEEFIVARRPDCIVSDMIYPWTADLAAHLGIPRFHFNGSCMFYLSLEDATRRPDSPHCKVQSDYEPFIIPNLPDSISMTRSRIPDYDRDPKIMVAQLAKQWKEAELKSYGVLVNSFYELESAYTEHYKKIAGTKVFNIGPVALIHRNTRDKAERVYKTVVGENECLSWLDSKKPNSVLYICFGSGCKFPDEQLMEIACGLEASGHQFIWVVHGRDKHEEETDDKWLPKGFHDRAEGRCMVLKGWAPQVLILDHPSVGGFLTHCGWNSVIEAVSSGVPMITWPLQSDQFYNEKLLTQVLKIGVEVGAEDWTQWSDVGKKVIKRDKITKAVRRLMDDGGDEAVVMMREKARELGEKAKRAVEEGGSSHTNLTILIEELKLLADRSKAP